MMSIGSWTLSSPPPPSLTYSSLFSSLSLSLLPQGQSKTVGGKSSNDMAASPVQSGGVSSGSDNNVPPMPGAGLTSKDIDGIHSVRRERG